MLVLALAVITADAQKKPKINQAERARTLGELGNAKNIIDQAAVFEKIKDDGKTWYYRGLIYAALDTTTNPKFQNLADDPLKIAMRSFAKADELSKGDKEYYITGSNGLPVLKSQQIQGLWYHYLNKGVARYNEQDNAKAYEYFKKMTLVQPKDTTGYIYAASAAQAGRKYDEAAENYYILINDLDYQSKDMYNALIYIEGTVNEDEEKALEVIRMAREQFPGDSDLAKSEINALIKMERVDEAKEELEAAIKNDPKSPDLWFNLGILYDGTDDFEKAKEAYTKSLEADPGYFNSQYNLAVLSYNKAVELIKEQNNLSISAEDKERSKTMQADIRARLKEALPHWEKILEKDSDNRTAMETLQYIYSRLEMNDKAIAMKAKLEADGTD